MKRPTLRAVHVGIPMLLCALMAVRAAGTQPVDRGGILVNADGMTLYVFDRDVPNSGRSACVGHCTRLWEPALVRKEMQAGSRFTIVMREDGSRQWAYEGKPLYLYAGDRLPGDQHGDKFKNVWHVVRQ